MTTQAPQLRGKKHVVSNTQNGLIYWHIQFGRLLHSVLCAGKATPNSSVKVFSKAAGLPEIFLFILEFYHIVKKAFSGMVCGCGIF
jgi:hypothetical protein